jgi:hypothetical protein
VVVTARRRSRTAPGTRSKRRPMTAARAETADLGTWVSVTFSDSLLPCDRVSAGVRSESS